MKKQQRRLRTTEELLNDQSIRNPLREYLRDRGKTLVELSRETGISYNSLQMYALGYRACPDEARREIAEALNLAPAKVPIR